VSNGRRFKRRVVISREIPDGASQRDKEGAVRRRLVALTGKCPCGAVLRIPDEMEAGTVTVVAIEHEDDCPAVEKN
jgi:hypothetical protein